jgi:hypothetical protein
LASVLRPAARVIRTRTNPSLRDAEVLHHGLLDRVGDRVDLRRGAPFQQINGDQRHVVSLFVSQVEGQEGVAVRVTGAGSSIRSPPAATVSATTTTPALSSSKVSESPIALAMKPAATAGRASDR